MNDNIEIITNNDLNEIKEYNHNKKNYSKKNIKKGGNTKCPEVSEKLRFPLDCSKTKNSKKYLCQYHNEDDCPIKRYPIDCEKEKFKLDRRCRPYAKKKKNDFKKRLEQSKIAKRTGKNPQHAPQKKYNKFMKKWNENKDIAIKRREDKALEKKTKELLEKNEKERIKILSKLDSNEKEKIKIKIKELLLIQEDERIEKIAKELLSQDEVIRSKQLLEIESIQREKINKKIKELLQKKNKKNKKPSFLKRNTFELLNTLNVIEDSVETSFNTIENLDTKVIENFKKISNDILKKDKFIEQEKKKLKYGWDIYLDNNKYFYLYNINYDKNFKDKLDKILLDDEYLDENNLIDRLDIDQSNKTLVYDPDTVKYKNNVKIKDNTNLKEIKFDKLLYIGKNLFINDNNKLTNIELDKLKSVNNIEIDDNKNLSKINLSSLNSANRILIKGDNIKILDIRNLKQLKFYGDYLGGIQINTNAIVILNSKIYDYYNNFYNNMKNNPLIEKDKLKNVSSWIKNAYIIDAKKTIESEDYYDILKNIESEDYSDKIPEHIKLRVALKAQERSDSRGAFEKLRRGRTIVAEDDDVSKSSESEDDYKGGILSNFSLDYFINYKQTTIKNINQETINKAILIEAVYYSFFNNDNYVLAQKFLVEKNILDYSIDKDLSISESLVLFKNTDVIIAYRGSYIKNNQDLLVDILFEIDDKNKESYFEKFIKQINDVTTKYKKPLELIGHSKGHYIAYVMGDKFSINTTGFNSTFGKNIIDLDKANTTPLHKFYRVTDDIASYNVSLKNMVNFKINKFNIGTYPTKIETLTNFKWKIYNIHALESSVTYLETHYISNFVKNNIRKKNSKIEESKSKEITDKKSLKDFGTKLIEKELIDDSEIKNDKISFSYDDYKLFFKNKKFYLFSKKENKLLNDIEFSTLAKKKIVENEFNIEKKRKLALLKAKGWTVILKNDRDFYKHKDHDYLFDSIVYRLYYIKEKEGYDYTLYNKYTRNIVTIKQAINENKSWIQKLGECIDYFFYVRDDGELPYRQQTFWFLTLVIVPCILFLFENISIIVLSFITTNFNDFINNILEQDLLNDNLKDIIIKISNFDLLVINLDDWIIFPYFYIFLLHIFILFKVLINHNLFTILLTLLIIITIILGSFRSSIIKTVGPVKYYFSESAKMLNKSYIKTNKLETDAIMSK